MGEEPDIIVPLQMDAQTRGGESWLTEPDYNWLSIMGRLKPGYGIEAAQAEVGRYSRTSLRRTRGRLVPIGSGAPD